MRPRTLIVLFALVAGVGALIWFFERELPSTDERAKLSKKLVRLEPDSVRAIVLTAGEQRLRLERAGPVGNAGDGGDAGDQSAEWMLTQPRTGRADSREVEDFLRRIRDLKKQRTLQDGSRDQLGLDQPRAEIALEIESGDIILRFGGKIPASSNTIVEVGNGPPFYVVSDSLFEDTAREPNGWRSRDAIPIQESRIEKIEVLNPGTGVVLERSGESFRLVGPIEDLADEDRVSTLLSALTELEIEEFVDQPDGTFEPSAAAVRLTITGEEEPLLVEIDSSPSTGTTGTGGDLAAVRVGGQVFKAYTDLASLLALAPGEWQSTSWSDRDIFETESFRVVRSGGESHYERREGEWWRGDVRIQYSLASAFLRALAGARGAPVDSEVGQSAREAGELLEVGAEVEAEVEIELESSGGKETLRLWADVEGYLAERSGRATLLRLDAESAETFFAELEALEAAPETPPDQEAFD